MNFIFRRNAKIILLFSLFLIPIPIYSLSVTALEQTDLTNIRVAIYNNQVSDTNLASRIALQNMFLWMNADVQNITAPEIRAGDLTSFNIFVMPGRSDSTSYYELESQGVSNLLNFVQNGGSYFGICGGVVFAARSDVNLFSGALLPVSGESITTHLVEMRINIRSISPDLSIMNETFSTLFWGSSYFIPDNPSQINTIALYSNCNESGMITYRYGLGSVFLSSPHTEFEENSDRDGTGIFDGFNDMDSEWDLMLKISQWLIDAPFTQITILWVMSISGGAIIVSLVVLFIKKRKDLNSFF